jgi:hypothetical protein
MNPSTTIGGNLELALYSKTHLRVEVKENLTRGFANTMRNKSLFHLLFVNKRFEIFGDSLQ